MENEAATLVGQTVAGKYAVEHLLAIGGMGAVYRARQIALDRFVALKILHRDLASDRQYVERFRTEAQAASRLDHPHSVRMIDFGEDGDGLLYIAMEYAEGRNLAVVIGQDTPLPEPRIVQLMSQVLSALAVAHEMGVVHRDLKPENIIVTRVTGDDGEAVEVAKVCDFGIAKVVPRKTGAGSGERPLSTLRGVLMGTPEYMSPEQARGEEMTAGSDLYSAGVVLYHLITGQVPFMGDNPVATALKHVTDPPVRPSAHRRMNPRLEAACLKALKKDPAERYASARDMRQALRAALALAPETPKGTRVPTPPATPAVPAAAPTDPAIPTLPAVVMRRSSSGRPVLLGLAAVAVAGAAVFVGLRRQREVSGQAQPSAAAAERLPEVTPVQPAPPPPAPVPALAPGPTIAAAPAPERPAVQPENRRQRAQRRLRVREPEVPSAPLDDDEVPAPMPPPVLEPAPQAAPPVAHSAPPPPAPPPVHKAWDVSRATVSVVEVTTTSAISVAKIRAGVRVSPLQACYQEALRARGGPASGVATLHIQIDVNGAVRAASLKGGDFLPAMKPCLEQVIRAARVKDIDTGDASATIVMKFQAGA
jgi:serine/threonine protein kinase